MVHREDVIPAPEPGSHGLATPGDPEIEDYRRNQVRDDKTTMHFQVKEPVLCEDFRPFAGENPAFTDPIPRP